MKVRCYLKRKINGSKLLKNQKEWKVLIKNKRKKKASEGC